MHYNVSTKYFLLYAVIFIHSNNYFNLILLKLPLDDGTALSNIN